MVHSRMHSYATIIRISRTLLSCIQNLGGLTMGDLPIDLKAWYDRMLGKNDSEHVRDGLQCDYNMCEVE